MPTKNEAKHEATQLRKLHHDITVNIKEVSEGNFGLRFSPKGKRDSFDYKKGMYGK